MFMPIALPPSITLIQVDHLPVVVKINHLSIYASTYSPTSLNPNTLGQKPECELRNPQFIQKLFQFIRKKKTSGRIETSLIRFVFRYDNTVTYVDCSGVVLDPKGTFMVDPASLEKFLIKMGCAQEPKAEDIPLDWLPKLPSGNDSTPTPCPTGAPVVRQNSIRGLPRPWPSR